MSYNRGMLQITKENMYKKVKIPRTSINRYEVTDGETIEAKVNRVKNNKEPIKDGAPLIYTERNEGVLAGYDIRTDRWDLAVDATDKITASELSKRAERHKEPDKPDAKIGGPESTQATE